MVTRLAQDSTMASRRPARSMRAAMWESFSFRRISRSGVPDSFL